LEATEVALPVSRAEAGSQGMQRIGKSRRRPPADQQGDKERPKGSK